MEFVYYTAAGLILYFLSDWILRKVEQMRGEAFEQRTLIFFVISRLPTMSQKRDQYRLQATVDPIIALSALKAA